jgi:hypothetical protein
MFVRNFMAEVYASIGHLTVNSLPSLKSSRIFGRFSSRRSIGVSPRGLCDIQFPPPWTRVQRILDAAKGAPKGIQLPGNPAPETSSCLRIQFPLR